MAKYIRRDPEGNVSGIVGSATQPFQPSMEVMQDDDPALIAYLDAVNNPPTVEPPPPVLSKEEKLKEDLGKNRGKSGNDIMVEVVEAMLIWFEALDTKKQDLTKAIQNIRIGGPANEIQPGPANKLIEALEPLLNPPPEIKTLLQSYRSVK